MAELQTWYRAFRKQGNKPPDAIWSARCHVKAEAEANATLAALSPASLVRVKDFVHDFIRGRDVEYLTSERDSDFINEPERAERCYDAAESGCDGKTHSEVIDDWRDAFGYWLSDRRRGKDSADPDRFADAVRADFALTEMWHARNGSLFTEIG